MALIKCPECGKEISDKAPTCINCGCPIEKDNVNHAVLFKGFQNASARESNSSYVQTFLNQKLGIDLATIQNIMNNPPQVILNGLTEENAIWIVNQLRTYKCILEVTKSKCSFSSTNNEVVSDAVIGKTIIRCPRCGSQNFTTGQRGYNIVFGFWGSGQTVNRCGNCGCTWHPNN